MKGLVLAVLTALALACASAEDQAEVVVLTNSNFDEVVTEGFWLVELYAPWCGHCKRLNPILSEIAPEAKSLHGMHIGKVDATVHTKIGDRLEVKGYPSLRFRMNLQEPWRKYEGGRTAKDLLAFAERMNGPAVQQLSTSKDLESFYARLTTGAGVFLASSTGDSPLEAAFATAAAELQHAAYFASGSAALLGKDTPTAPFVAVVERGEAPRVYSLPNHTTEGLQQWISSSNFPLVNELGSHNFRALGRKGKLVVIGIVDPDAPETPAFLEGLQAVARSTVASSELATVEGAEVPISNRFVFGHLDGVKWKDFVVQFDVFGDLPKVVVLDMPKEIFYSDAEVNEADEIDTFLREVHQGQVPARREGMKSTMSRMWRKIKSMGPYSAFLALPVLLLLLAFFTSPRDDDLTPEAAPPAERKKKTQ